ncbi:MAG TPA: DUF4202 domain-containing protein [Cyclobacteriaceae bacterium]
MKESAHFDKAIAAFDEYNSNDPNKEEFNGNPLPKELLYAQRMSTKLIELRPDAREDLKLAARSQHIGRWEIPRSSYPMDRNGYLKWRGQLKVHHSKIAERILTTCGYDSEIIDKVKALLMKKQLLPGSDTQLLEDVVCLVFIEFYLSDFAAKYEEDKVIDIIMKTMKKMSPEAIQKATQLPVDKNVLAFLGRAANKLS